ncbi:chaperone protein dnaJ 11, chloroplastic-like [Ziziphus jujuba]|uniref:Chaperone protein dnaJ 11, chloroplastic-like n=1 Tax=Ziziphus jujuba TaxID=326968 RepID=A0A6P3ZU01_ZIZJJ|nr:chaperone protein dnaJ 11, chloroplastic-like [Ziziphus jujuba]
MISTSTTSFISSAPFLAPKVRVPNSNPYPSNSIAVRPLTISAASCASTAEKPAMSHTASASSLYDVLGIRMGATNQEIKTAYRRLARVVHPDVVANGPRRTSTQTSSSADDFLKIHEAYSTLSDPDKRADYDRMLYRRRGPVSSPAAMSYAASRFSASMSMRRTWETDQCW